MPLLYIISKFAAKIFPIQINFSHYSKRFSGCFTTCCFADDNTHETNDENKDIQQN